MMVLGGGGGGGDFGGGESDEEAGADGEIVLNADGAGVLGDDASGDGQAKAGAASFGGEIRKEETVFVFGRDAVAGVLDADFDVFGIVIGASGNGDGADGGGFQGLSGIVDEIDQDAAEKRLIGANRREIRGEGGVESDAIEAAGENFDGLANDGVDVGGLEPGGRKANELGELADKLSEGGDFALDEARAFVDEASEFGVAGSGGLGGIALFEVTRQSLSGELDGSEGIFDFMRDAARDFLPGGGFLGVEEFGEIVEDDDVAGIGAARSKGADGDGGMENAARGEEFEFARDDAHAERTAKEVLNDAGIFGADEIFERLRFARFGAEDARDGGIDAEDLAFGSK